MKVYLLAVAFVLVAYSAIAATFIYFQSAQDVALTSTIAVVGQPNVSTENPPLSCAPGQVVMTGTNGSYCSP